MGNGEFLKVRQCYRELRREQRQLIAGYLERQGFAVAKNGGRGIRNYTSGRRFEVPYDLSDWLWIDVEKNGKRAMVSLQSFDRDPASKNYHVLTDRLGIFLYDGARTARESYYRMETLDVDLPMDDGKLAVLADVLNEKLDGKTSD